MPSFIHNPLSSGVTVPSVYFPVDSPSPYPSPSVTSRSFMSRWESAAVSRSLSPEPALFKSAVSGLFVHTSSSARDVNAAVT